MFLDLALRGYSSSSTPGLTTKLFDFYLLESKETSTTIEENIRDLALEHCLPLDVLVCSVEEMQQCSEKSPVNQSEKMELQDEFHQDIPVGKYASSDKQF